jgi:hypothetical protein
MQKMWLKRGTTNTPAYPNTAHTTTCKLLGSSREQAQWKVEKKRGVLGIGL